MSPVAEIIVNMPNCVLGELAHGMGQIMFDCCFCRYGVLNIHLKMSILSGVRQGPAKFKDSPLHFMGVLGILNSRKQGNVVQAGLSDVNNQLNGTATFACPANSPSGKCIGYHTFMTSKWEQ